ncbi:helix-turn-helix transcriptional regulator [Paenibacillaceae bacterium WGS1546]|uniref:helix-turn-helix transcriptional regulator n=1 Tax=Cohnella sp. WGS1546 TaxID=3366810 RepID=UPI00372D3038
MRADRLLTILSLLQTRGRMSTRELAERLEVSARTVHRDMEALSAAGIPVYAERGSRGGWALSEGYRTRMTGMTTEEIRSLLLLHSSSIVRDLGLQGPSESALLKLLAALPAAARRDAEYVRERIHVDGAGWRDASPARNAHLHAAQEAAWEQRLLRIAYRGWDAARATARTVKPLGLVAKQGVWYLVAETGDPAKPSGEDADSIRTFRISRFEEARVLDETFERPADFRLETYWERSTERFLSTLPRYPARVRVASEHWDRFRRERYVKTENESASDDGVWTEADAEFETLDSACEILLKFGRHAQALMPDELRRSLREESRAMAALYED